MSNREPELARDEQTLAAGSVAALLLCFYVANVLDSYGEVGKNGGKWGKTGKIKSVPPDNSVGEAPVTVLATVCTP